MHMHAAGDAHFNAICSNQLFIYTPENIHGHLAISLSLISF